MLPFRRWGPYAIPTEAQRAALHQSTYYKKIFDNFFFFGIRLTLSLVVMSTLFQLVCSMVTQFTNSH